MPIYNFDASQKFSTLDSRPDNRTEAERYLSKLSVYNHDNPDIAWAERSAEELINLSGAIVTIYQRPDDAGGYDDVWNEDADPALKNGVKMKGYFIPEPAAVQLTKWGLDVEVKPALVFARAVLFQKFGRRMLRPGDVVRAPYNSLNPIQISNDNHSRDASMTLFRITNPTDMGMFRYRWLYFRCDMELLTGDKSVGIEHE